MRNIFLLLICLFSGYILEAQNLEGISKQKPVTLTGGITARAILYDANGIPARRKAFSYIISGNPTISIYNSFTIPISFVYSEQERSYSQPFNQFGMSPYYKWITLHAGYRNINFSPFTLAGHTFLGGGIELKPGIFRFGFIAGRFNRAVDADSIRGSLQPVTYASKGFATKIGIGKGSNFFEISLLKVKDDSTSAHPDSSNIANILPAENIVLGMNGQIRFLKRFTFTLEAATSIYTRNLKVIDEIPDSMTDFFTRNLGKYITTNSTTERYNAIQTSLSYQQKVFSAKIQYRRIDPDYKSMGAYFINSDLENITIAPSITLFKNKFRLGGSVGFQHDNLNNQKLTSSKRIISSSNMTADFNDHFGIDFSYSNYSNTQVRKAIVVNDSFRIAQVSQNFSLTPRFIYANEKHVHSLVLSANYNIFSSVDKSTDDQNDTKCYNLFLNYQITLVPRNTTLSMNWNYTDMKTGSIEEGNYGITLGLNKTMLKSKITAGWFGSFLKGLQGKSTGLILNQNLNASYRINKHHSFGINVSYINNKSQQTEFTPSYSEWKADLNYRYIF